jgi:GTP 3',8-cyclase
MALDRFGRQLNYLRISLTDRCNLRCQYCMPEDTQFKPMSSLMSDDEIIRLVHLFANLGFKKIRLTGGEPTVRPNIVDLVHRIAITPRIKQLTMTTNGTLFSNLAKDLKEAGLQRVNISLDTLDPEKYSKITRRGIVESVWEGISAAEEVGLTPIKINVVVVRNFNDLDVIDLARLTYHRPWQVRFIEMMPFAGATDFQVEHNIVMGEIRQIIESAVGPLQPINNGILDGEAQLFRIPQSLGTIGFIASISQPFCASCTRVRLTADGRLRLCLLNEFEVDLLEPLRSGASDQILREIILDALWNKPWGHKLIEGAIPINRTMSQIGG